MIYWVYHMDPYGIPLVGQKEPPGPQAGAAASELSRALDRDLGRGRDHVAPGPSVTDCGIRSAMAS